MTNNTENLGQDLGRLFEVGFNVGMLTYIEQKQLPHHFQDIYRKDLRQLSFPRMIRQLVNKEGIINEKHREIIRKWSLFFLEKSFLAGLNLFPEYLQAIGWDKDNKIGQLKIIYYQCCFSDDNSLGTYPKGKEKANQDVISQFPDLTVDLNHYSQKGEFLNADTLVLLRCGKEWRVLCLDYSIFSIRSIRDLADLDSMEVLRNLLLKEVSYLKSKSVFANLGLDTQQTSLDLSESLKRYYLAFKTRDKETIKLIQAGSYVNSFSQFLLDQGIISGETNLTYNILGYSDRAVSTMTLKPNQSKILSTCSEIYKNEPQEESLLDNRRQVLNVMRRNAAKSFQDGKTFINNLFQVKADQITQVTHQETITDFQNLVDPISPELAYQLQLDRNYDLRQAHDELIKKQLNSEVNYVFLTGNPGIGKTSAIAQFLKQTQILEAGFLFFYVSPRKQVNLDILEKFTNPETQKLCDDRIFAINTNADIISSNQGNYTVQFKSNLNQDNFTAKAVQFLNQDRQQQQSDNPDSNFRRIAEDQIQNRGKNNRGVLASMGEAIYALLNRNVSNQIIATAAIQSLKKTQQGNDTLHHLEKIFRDAYNQGEGKVIPSKMEELSNRIKHIFIMIDEITGDDSGVEFLHRITQILKRYELLSGSYNFNIKIITADASIVDANVIKQHLSEASAEPNKIFFRQAKPDNNPLSSQPFQYQKCPAVVINTNAYPASCLNLNYKLFIKSAPVETHPSLQEKYDLEEKVQDQITEDIHRLIHQADTEQIIVYIQHKTRLKELIDRIRQREDKFQQYQDYLEIHASLSEEEKNEIHRYKDQVKVIFMTASASRGLSFPKTKHILIDVPRFEIEKNLMEIIQVIYRGRGYDNENRTLDQQARTLIFYLSESAIYYEDNFSPEATKQKENLLQESLLNLVNILLILKASVMTRIRGYGTIGNNQFMLIPIGGKSVFAAGQTFGSQMSTLIKQLKQEYHKNPQNQQLREVYQQLEKLLASVEIVLLSEANSQQQKDFSYLDLINSLSADFSKIINHSLEGLLEFVPLQKGFINGSLLLIPIPDKRVEQTYKIKLANQITKNNQLLEKLEFLYNSSHSPENLRSSLKSAIDFIKNLLGTESDKTQNFKESSKYEDQYYAFPLFNFISRNLMQEYFNSEEKEPADKTFRDILASYLRSLYPVGDILPLGDHYKDFPFLLFRSYSLNESRTKLFTDKYFLNSNELNVLNLILYQER